MRRPYTAAMYRRLVERLAAAIPGLGLGADVIVGFPGETDADFAATLALVEALPFSYLHVFPYSDAAGDGGGAARRRGSTRARSRAAEPAALRDAGAREAAGLPAGLVGRSGGRAGARDARPRERPTSSVSPATTWRSPSPGRMRSCDGSRASG